MFCSFQAYERSVQWDVLLQFIEYDWLVSKCFPRAYFQWQMILYISKAIWLSCLELRREGAACVQLRGRLYLFGGPGHMGAGTSSKFRADLGRCGCGLRLFWHALSQQGRSNWCIWAEVQIVQKYDYDILWHIMTKSSGFSQNISKQKPS